MFDIFKPKYKKPLFEGLTDIHNHLLPGIDDGSKSVVMSEEMLRLYEELGFKKVIPTPHIYTELYPNTPETINGAFQFLTHGLKDSNISSDNNSTLTPTSFAAEYMVDETFMNLLETNQPLLELDHKHILVEMHFFGQLDLIREACFALCSRGYQPILAHPERYALVDKISGYQGLKNQGFCLQLNALSLMGHYGPEVKEKAEKLLDKGLYDLVGTDAHHPGHLKQLQKLTLSKKQGLRWEALIANQNSLF